MEEYLLRVGTGAREKLSQTLHIGDKKLEHVRLATLAPLSNYGYPPGSEGSLLAINELGIVIGVEDDIDVPRDFVPWHNVSYLTDGTKLKADVAG